MCKNPLPARVTSCSLGCSGWTIGPLWACADPCFTSVYVTHVNNLIFQFSLWYKRYDKADISAGLLWDCWQKRLQLASFSQRGELQRWGLLTRASGKLTSHTQRFVSHSELCLLLPSRYLESLCQREAQPRTKQRPRKSQVHQGNVVWSCVRNRSERWLQSGVGVNDTFWLPKYWTLDGVWELAQRN